MAFFVSFYLAFTDRWGPAVPARAGGVSGPRVFLGILLPSCFLGHRYPLDKERGDKFSWMQRGLCQVREVVREALATIATSTGIFFVWYPG